ncbi:MAG: TetR/AcrR family transcriptional regulator [Telmatospirillum sp.]|nr:TetR/AcrR family transcriptional regulator [Telmatospirillum sp.]
MPAGRPRNFDTGAALDAAMKVFWQYGYEGASLDLLTQEMQINRPSLYGAFGDKADLFEKAVARYQEKYAGPNLRVLADAPNLEAALADFFAATLRLVAGKSTPRGCLVACVLADICPIDPRWRRLMGTIAAASRAQFSAALERFVAPKTARRLGNLLAVCAPGLAVLARSGASAQELAEASDVARAACRAVGMETA